MLDIFSTTSALQVILCIWRSLILILCLHILPIFKHFNVRKPVYEVYVDVRFKSCKPVQLKN